MCQRPDLSTTSDPAAAAAAVQQQQQDAGDARLEPGTIPVAALVSEFLWNSSRLLSARSKQQQ